MSRTDKDAPRWVRAMHDPGAVFHHHVTCVDHRPRPGSQPCGDRCSWWSTEHSEPRRFRWSSPPGRDALRTFAHVPERRAVRRAAADAARDVNAHGDTEIEPTTGQHRHVPRGGGYWD